MSSESSGQHSEFLDKFYLVMINLLLKQRKWEENEK